MNFYENFYVQGQVDFLMTWIDCACTHAVKKHYICEHLNIDPNEIDLLLEYYRTWKYHERVKEAGKANVVQCFIKRHQFLDITQQASLLNLSLSQLQYYLSFKF